MPAPGFIHLVNEQVGYLVLLPVPMPVFVPYLCAVCPMFVCYRDRPLNRIVWIRWPIVLVDSRLA